MLPYPSTFANAMSFLILSMLAKAKFKWNPANITGISLLCSIVLISHPPTALFLFIGIGSMNWAWNGYSVKTGILRSVVIIFPCIVLSICWPYYHIIDLFTIKGYNFHSDSLPLYQGIISRNWPLLFVFPAFFINREPVIHFFLATIITLTAIYFTGYLLKIYGASRILFNLTMFADLLIGYLLVKLITQANEFGKFYAADLCFFLILSIGFNHQYLMDVYKRFSSQGDTSYYMKFDFLRTTIHADDIVLSDAESNWIIPSFNGKVIASKHPLYWFNDIYQRRADVKSFFLETSTDSTRKSIIEKYKPDYILIDYTKVQLDGKTIQWLKTIGKDIYSRDQLELIKLK